MKRGWGIWVHVGLLGVAGALAWSMSSYKAEPNVAGGPVTDLWRVEPDQVKSAVFETTERRTTVDTRHDTVGDYSVVTVESFAKPESDAGVPAKQAETKRFISVDSAEKVRQGLARFKIMRTLGKVDANRATEFGLDKPEGTLKVVLAQGPHAFTVGASTPGGGNYYVRDQATGVVQVAVGDPIATLMYAESRMMERDLHGFKSDDVTRAVVQANGKRRQLERVVGKPNSWADATNGAKEDETASNWVTKLTQLRVTAYEEKLEPPPAPIVRIEYGDAKINLGFAELFKVPAEKDGPRYFVRSERSRWYAEVIKSQAEQLERDVSLVAK
jgi:hypothetical protein